LITARNDPSVISATVYTTSAPDPVKFGYLINKKLKLH
jgi:hypothetical protein